MGDSFARTRPAKMPVPTWPRPPKRPSVRAPRNAGAAGDVVPAPVAAHRPDALVAQLTPHAHSSGKALLRRALERFALGTSSASDLTHCAYHLSQLGCAVPDGLAMKPRDGDPYHNCSRAVGRALGLETRDKEWYRAKIPMWNVRSGRRKVVDMCFCLPHMMLAEAVRDSELPETPAYILESPIYREHPVVREHNNAVCIGIFIDSTDYGKDASVVCWYYNFGDSPKRYVAAVVRKDETCKCGCSGSCTTLAVDRVIAWSLNACARATHPLRNHDGAPFAARSTWESHAGTPLGRAGALTHVRCDLLGAWEYLGFQRWNQDRPCFLCRCQRRQLFDFVARVGWDAVTPDDYHTAANSFSIRRRLTRPEVAEVFAVLADTWHGKLGGRCLTRDMPALGLFRGDRLMVGGDVSDRDGGVWIELDALFAKLGGSPHCRLCFFRLGSGCTFPSPILTDVVGAGLHTVCLDRMHVLDLGALSSWSGAVVSELLKAGTFGTKDKSFGALSAVLRRWLRRRRSSTWIKQVREKNLTGGAQKPFLKFRTSGASKMRAMLPFLLRTLSGKRLALDAAGRPGTALYRAGLRYNAIYALMRRAKARRLTTEEEQQLARHAVVSQRHWAAAGGHMYPKNHFLVHMAETIVKQGPVATWTDADESFNRIVKKIFASTLIGDARTFSKLWLFHRIDKILACI